MRDDYDIYGQLEQILEIPLPTQGTASSSDPACTYVVVLAIVTPFHLTSQHPALGHPYTDGSTRASIVIDVKDFECVIARVERDKKHIALIDRAKIMELNFARGVPDMN